jgi:adenine-specific DNA-methyltransferase
VIANTLKRALKDRDKLLLTATPLQNSLLELYGLVSFIDEYLFGDLKSFREQFVGANDPKLLEVLKTRLKTVCQRTLRRDVLPYIRYTKRIAILEKFEEQQVEAELYKLVSTYLERPQLQALPSGQRGLITLVLRKLLASSTFAIAGALNTMSSRLTKRLNKSDGQLLRSNEAASEDDLSEVLDDDYEILDEVAEEWTEETENDTLSTNDRSAIQQEIADLNRYRDLAQSIEQNSKGQALLKALKSGFEKLEQAQAPSKAIIFTESRRTQEYLLRLLGQSSYHNGIVLFNGSNNDSESRKIYERWLQRHQNTDRITGSRTADMRSALVDYFREEGQIMIATEAGAEGINLQFCSLVVNYDLPWNPQRIEQRIGRCHRYGQEYDVVVVNFLNKGNEADRRVYELLSEKFALFEGVFGASDEVLGAIGSGIDFEKRIAEIYHHHWRSPEAINQAFDQLQQELSGQIDAAVSQARQQLLENFDVEVNERLRLREKGKEQRTHYEQKLMRVTSYELNGHAQIDENDGHFTLLTQPFHDADFPLGRYELPRRSGEAHLYRLGHPLALRLLNKAKARAVPPTTLTFVYSDHRPVINALAPFAGRAGTLTIALLTITSPAQIEDDLIYAAISDDGQELEQQQVRRIFDLAVCEEMPYVEMGHSERLQILTAQRQQEILAKVSERNASLFEQETNKLDNWAEDRKVGLEREIKELDRQIKEARRAATTALGLQEKIDAQKRIKNLEAKRNSARRALFEAQDEVDRQRDELIIELEGKLKQQVDLQPLFTIRWRLV